MSTATKRDSEDKTLYLHVNQPLVIAAVGSSAFLSAVLNSQVFVAVTKLCSNTILSPWSKLRSGGNMQLVVNLKCHISV